MAALTHTETELQEGRPVRVGQPVRRAGEPGRPPRRIREGAVADGPPPQQPTACQPRVHRTRVTDILLVAVLTAITVFGFGMVSGQPQGGSVPVPETTNVVQLEAGETLSELAARVAPGSEPSEVVDRIRELNDLGSVPVRPGQPLWVPDSRPAK